MTRLKYVIFAFAFVISQLSYGAVPAGQAAGSNAADIAIGSSAVAGLSVAAAVTGVILLSMGGSSDGNETSASAATTTTTTTTTITAP